MTATPNNATTAVIQPNLKTDQHKKLGICSHEYAIQARPGQAKNEKKKKESRTTEPNTQTQTQPPHSAQGLLADWASSGLSKEASDSLGNPSPAQNVDPGEPLLRRR